MKVDASAPLVRAPMARGRRWPFCTIRENCGRRVDPVPRRLRLATSRPLVDSFEITWDVPRSPVSVLTMSRLRVRGRPNAAFTIADLGGSAVSILACSPLASTDRAKGNGAWANRNFRRSRRVACVPPTSMRPRPFVLDPGCSPGASPRRYRLRRRDSPQRSSSPSSLSSEVRERAYLAPCPPGPDYLRRLGCRDLGQASRRRRRLPSLRG